MKRMISIALVTLGLAAGLAGVAGAQPSMYYKWKNTSTGATLCDPENPGAQWQKVGGPFSDQNCSIPFPQ